MIDIFFQVGNFINLQPEDRVFNDYRDALKHAQKLANDGKNNEQAGDVIGIWKYEENILPYPVTLVTWEGVFDKRGE